MHRTKSLNFNVLSIFLAKYFLKRFSFVSRTNCCVGSVPTCWFTLVFVCGRKQEMLERLEQILICQQQIGVTFYRSSSGHGGQLLTIESLDILCEGRFRDY